MFTDNINEQLSNCQGCEGWGRIPKWASLEKRSTTTKIVVKPLYDGRPTIKSKERSSQQRKGSGMGCKSSGGH